LRGECGSVLVGIRDKYRGLASPPHQQNITIPERGPDWQRHPHIRVPAPMWYW
jgi:hypothetical protein